MVAMTKPFENGRSIFSIGSPVWRSIQLNVHVPANTFSRKNGNGDGAYTKARTLRISQEQASPEPTTSSFAKPLCIPFNHATDAVAKFLLNIFEQLFFNFSASKSFFLILHTPSSILFMYAHLVYIFVCVCVCLNATVCVYIFR